MVNINIELKGYTAEVIEKMISEGYAKTKTEAIRLAIFEFDNMFKLSEDELYAKATKKMLNAIETGKEGVRKYHIK